MSYYDSDWYKEREEKDRIRKEWLSNLKVGDEVAIPHSGWHRRPPTLHSVTGFTAKFIRVGFDLFDKESGRRRGGGDVIVPIDDEVREEIKRDKVMNFFKIDERYSSFKPSKLTTEQLETLIATIQEMERVNDEVKAKESESTSGESNN